MSVNNNTSPFNAFGPEVPGLFLPGGPHGSDVERAVSVIFTREAQHIPGFSNIFNNPPPDVRNLQEELFAIAEEVHPPPPPLPPLLPPRELTIENQENIDPYYHPLPQHPPTHSSAYDFRSFPGGVR